jgi:hypothetical protein
VPYTCDTNSQPATPRAWGAVTTIVNEKDKISIDTRQQKTLNISETATKVDVVEVQWNDRTHVSRKIENVRQPHNVVSWRTRGCRYRLKGERDAISVTPTTRYTVVNGA